jgi:hypothetical protein
MAKRWTVLEFHAPVFGEAVAFPAINHNVVAAGYQPCGNFFRESFKTTVTCRNTPCSQ